MSDSWISRPPERPPPRGPALAQPGTAAALRARRRRCLRFGAGGLGVLGLTNVYLAATGYPVEGPLATIGVIGTVLSVIMVGWGIAAWIDTFVMRRLLSRCPWEEYPCRFAAIAVGDGAEAVLLLTQPLGPPHVLRVWAARWRWKALDAQDGRSIWFAGDPRTRGIASPPGGTDLFTVRAIRFPFWRHYLERRVDRVIARRPLEAKYRAALERLRGRVGNPWTMRERWRFRRESRRLWREIVSEAKAAGHR